MKTRTKVTGVTATTIIASTIILLSLGGQVLGADTSVIVQSPTGTIYPGQTFTVTVYCSPTRPVKSYEFKVNYDKNVVKALSVTEGNFFSGYQTFFSPGIIDNTNGNIKNIYNLIVGAGTVVNPGNFVIITFEALNYGLVNITLTNLGVTNETAYIPVTLTNGVVNIYSSYDMNLDRTINLLDLMDVASYYGQTGAPGWIKQDINKDGQIKVLDLVILSAHWGPY